MKNKLSLLVLFTLLIMAVTFCKKKDDNECPACPSVQSISPTSGVWGTEVTITGINFNADYASNIVKFNGKQVDAADILSGSETQLVVKVPKSCGTGPVTVDVDADLTHIGTPPTFTYNFTSTVSDIGGDGMNVDPCINGQSFCGASNYIQPYGIAVTTQGDVIFDDVLNYCFYKLEKASTYSPCMYAGCAGSSGTWNNSGTYAAFLSPQFFNMDQNNTIYVCDGNTIRSISPSGNVTDWYTNTDYTMLSSVVFAPGNTNLLYTSDAGGNKIWKIEKNGAVFTNTLLAGQSGGFPGFADGNGTSASFNSPQDLVTDNNGNLYVIDRNNHAIRKITPGGEVTTLAGNGSPSYADGVGVNASFNQPSGICIVSNNLYVADKGNNCIRSITLSGTVSTVYTFSGGMGAPAPYDVAVDGTGNLYVTYTGNTGNGVKMITIE